MAAAFGSATSGFVDSVSTLTLNKPASTVADDVLVAILFMDHDGDPALLAAPNTTEWAQAGSTGYMQYLGYGKVWHKVVSSSEPSSYTFGTDGSAITVGFLIRVTGANKDGDAIDVISWGGSRVASTAHVVNSISPGGVATLELAAFAGAVASGTRSYTPPSGMTEIADTASSWLFAEAAYAANTGGSTGTRTATAATASRSLTVHLAVNSAGLTATGAQPGAETVTWIDPEGTSWPLKAEWNVKGRFMPGIEFEEDGAPEQPGSTVRAVRHGVHEFSYVCWIEGSTESDLRNNLRSLVRAMDPTRGEGRIRVRDQAGGQREIPCRYYDGLGLNESIGDMSGPLVQKAEITFRASDPYYYDVADTTHTFTTADPPAFFPFFPLRLASSEVFVETTINVEGDVDSWPVWTLYNQGSDLTILNQTTGKSLTLNVDFLDGEGCIIDTRPGIKTVTSLDGTNLFPFLSDDSALFPLVPGPNVLQVQLTGSDTDTYVTCVTRNRYLSP